ncbi:hypothetical protein RRF57_001630 [Xylaria bambusicola]|uniref:BTB domain-containing protein n=1 Tax=Xylaria bambusicola TaxID=326684 RepID=A0AAN7UBT8_9PEZI
MSSLITNQRSRSIGVNGDPSYATQPPSATSTTRPELVPSYPTPSLPLQHRQHMADQPHHPAVFHAPHPHHIHPHQHRHQISNGGGIMFGGFDSHTPSPVPPPGGFMPPPSSHINGDNRAHPRPNGHHHSQSSSNGFPAPINTHFRGDIMPMSTMDTYGTAPTHTPPVHMDAFTPGAGRYGPPTPHSFHGSHTSGEPNGMDNTLPYPPNGTFVSHPRHEHPAAHPHPPVPFPPFMPPHLLSRQFGTLEDDAMEGIRYIRSQFDNAELADCVLELISAKGRHHPVKISGHKLILARSPALKQYILNAQAQDPGSHTITMEIDDSYMRSDAWWTAVQRLYQHPLVPLPPMLGHADNGVDFVGNKVDRFGFCLGYAAAGSILSMRDVLVRGLEIASHTLTWDTVEMGLGFVLENTVQRHVDHSPELEAFSPSTLLEFGYGPETKILHSAILNFLINEFPANFELDAQVMDVPKIARIPTSAIVNTPPRTRATDKVVPTIARGTMARQTAKQTRLSSIKFGDLPAAYPDDGAPPHREPAECSSILSRILLNLSYDDLCQVLTSGSHGVSGWNSAQDRYHAVSDVVLEREARRLRAVEAVRSEVVPNAREIQSRLSAPHRYTIAEPWDVLNWKEEVTRDETPRIVRRWIPQLDVVQQPTQQRALPSYDVPDSMV